MSIIDSYSVEHFRACVKRDPAAVASRAAGACALAHGPEVIPLDPRAKPAVNLSDRPRAGV